MRWSEHSFRVRFFALLLGFTALKGVAFGGVPGSSVQPDKFASAETGEAAEKLGSASGAASQKVASKNGEGESGSKNVTAEKGAVSKESPQKGREAAELEREREKNPISIPLVPGYDSFGLNIPDHDDAGNLRSLFMIGAISRLDDRSVEIRDSFLETYRDDGSPDLSIELQKAVLDRFTRVLVAKTPVTLRREEFELKGASLEFNTATKEGGLGGPVQMTIYNGVQSDSSGERTSSSAIPNEVAKDPSGSAVEAVGRPPDGKK